MDAEKQDSQSGLAPGTPWLTFKRESDNVKIEARLVTLKSGKQMMLIKEIRMDDLLCPSCKLILTQGNAKMIPNFLLDPVVFHRRHKEYGRPRK